MATNVLEINPERLWDTLEKSAEIGRFRAVRAPVLIDGETAVLSRDAATVLGVREGEAVRVKS